MMAKSEPKLKFDLEWNEYGEESGKIGVEKESLKPS